MKSQGGATPRPSSIAKRNAVLAAAEAAFLSARFEDVTMDDITHSSGVSKQTIYAYFGTKDELFVELVTSMTRRAGDDVLPELADPVESAADVAPLLESLLARQLSAVLEPRILQLRRLVIGEVPRFPELAKAVFNNGPHRAITAIAEILTDLDARGLLAAPDPELAATQLNWLVMAAPVNEAMFLGDESILSHDEQREHVREAVHTFLAACRP